MAFQIVPMTGEHLAQVKAIERACFPDPWSDQVFADSLASEDTTALTALSGDGAVLGYLFSTAVLDEGGVDNIAVLPEARRQGVASALLDAFHAYGRSRGLRQVFLEVRPSNLGALALYGKKGYQEAGRRKNYYLRPREDAILMKLELTPCD